MADNDNIDYDGIIKEIDGIDPANNEEGLMQSYAAERLVELQKELSGIEPADRNDDHQLAWLGLYDKANALISELAGQSLDGISKEQLSAYESLIGSFASHVGEEYSGMAAELKGKLDARKEALDAEGKQEELETPTEERTVPSDTKEEELETPTEEKEDADIKDTVLDVDKQEFLDSINDENKEQIAERFNKIDEAADELGDVFAVPQDENAEDKFAGLRNFYDNLWIDREAPEDENAQPGEDDLKKRQQLKDRMQEMAKIMAIQDLVTDASLDGLPKEKIKERMQEAVIDNMSFLTYNLVANQCGFKVLEAGQDITKLTPKERQEHMAKLQDGYKAVFEGVNNTLSGGKATPISVGSPAINATMVPQYKEAKKFAKEFKLKTGVTKMLKRVKDFDAKMSKDHPYLWGFAKTTAISALTGPTGIMVYTGITVAKQANALRKEYKQQKAEKGEEALSVGKFLKKNSGKIASMVVSAGFAAYGGIGAMEGVTSLDFGAMAKSALHNTGLLGNMTGSLLSGDALNNAAQSLSWDGMKNAAGNMVDKIANVSNIDTSQVVQGLKDSYSPARLTRLAVSGLGVGIAKAHEAYSQAGDGNKWKAARKAFTAHLTGVLVGTALADTLTVTNNVMEQSALELQKIEAMEKEFENELQSIDQLRDSLHIPNDYDQHFENGGQEAAQPQHHAPQHNDTPAPEPEPAQEVETEPTVDLKVNGENVEAKLGNTLEETLDNAREQYLQDNPEIDSENNTVVIEGEGGKATIETQKEDIMKGEAVIGQETTVHREIETDEVQIKDDIQEVKTDTGQAKIMESEGRSDIDTNNNIPDGAKILNVTEFHNENQDLKLTEYEQDGKVYITDGNQTRLAPEGQSAEQRYQTWNNMLKETAAAGYDDNGQAIIQEQPAQEAVKGEVKEGVVNEPKGETKLSAEEMNKLRNGQSLESQRTSLADRVKGMKTDNGYDSFSSGAKNDYEEFMKSVNKEYSDGVASVNKDYQENLNNVQQDYKDAVDKNNAEFEQFRQEGMQAHDTFLAEKAAYESSHSGYQDYSASVQQLGLQNSSVLSHSEGVTVRTHEFEGNSASYKIYEQTEFRQANNGFVLVHNDEIRAVTTDGKGNLEFKISENGQVRNMTKDEVNNFCSEVKSQGGNSDNFNGKLLKHIEDTRSVKDAQGTMKYGVASNNHGNGSIQNTNTVFKGNSTTRI